MKKFFDIRKYADDNTKISINADNLRIDMLCKPDDVVYGFAVSVKHNDKWLPLDTYGHAKTRLDATMPLALVLRVAKHIWRCYHAAYTDGKNQYKSAFECCSLISEDDFEDI